MGEQAGAEKKVAETLAVRHRVLVDEKVIYEGGDWNEAAKVFLRNAQRLDVQRVVHQVEKRVVPLYSDPRTIWQ